MAGTRGRCPRGPGASARRSGCRARPRAWPGSAGRDRGCPPVEAVGDGHHDLAAAGQPRAHGGAFALVAEAEEAAVDVDDGGAGAEGVAPGLVEVEGQVLMRTASCTPSITSRLLPGGRGARRAGHYRSLRSGEPSHDGSQLSERPVQGLEEQHDRSARTASSERRISNDRSAPSDCGGPGATWSMRSGSTSDH